MVLFAIVLSVLTGIVYPLVVTGIAQLVFPHAANGSLVEKGLASARPGEVVKYALLGDAELAIGHTRYSTTGSSTWRNAQPVFRGTGDSGFALGHNGNLTNSEALKRT